MKGACNQVNYGPWNLNIAVQGPNSGAVGSCSVVNVKEFGAIGDGNADDTLAFRAAFQNALACGKYAYVPSGHYLLTGPGLLPSPGIIGDGVGLSRIKVEGDLTLRVNKRFRLQDVCFETETTYPLDGTSHGYLIEDTEPLLSPVIRNVHYVNTSNIDEGTRRTRSFMRIRCSDLDMSDVKVDGAASFLYVRNKNLPTDPDTGENFISKNLRIRNVTLYNVGVGFYFSHGVENTGFGEDDYVTDIFMDNIRLKNTLAQQYADYPGFRIEGRDLFMMERAKNVLLTNISCERALERAAYFNECLNVVASNVINQYCDGWKFVAGQNNGRMADGFSASNFRFVGGNPYTNEHVSAIQSQGFAFYDAKNIHINGVDAVGELPDEVGTNNNTIAYVVNLSRKIENIRVANVKAQNTMFGLALLDMRRHANAPDAKLTQAIIEDCTIINPVVSFTQTNQTAIQPLWYEADLTNGYVFQDITIRRVWAAQNYVNGVIMDSKVGRISTSRMAGLFRVNGIDGLTMEGNHAQGYANANGWIRVGSQSRNVILREDMLISDQITSSLYMPIPTGLYMSPGSQITSTVHRSRYFSGKQGTYFNKICIPCEAGDTGSEVYDPAANAIGWLKGNAHLQADEDEFWLPFSGAICSAYGTITFSNGEYVRFLAESDKEVTLIEHSPGVSPISQGGYICLYTYEAQGLTGLTVRNRSVVEVNALVEYRYEIKA